MSLSTITAQTKQKALAEKIRSQCGFLTKEDVEALKVSHPDFNVLIRWQCSREIVKVKNVAGLIQHSSKSLRDVCFIANTLNPFLKFYGVPPL